MCSLHEKTRDENSFPLRNKHENGILLAAQSKKAQPAPTVARERILSNRFTFNGFGHCPKTASKNIHFFKHKLLTACQ
jgi:hypothetical protein